MQKSYKIFQAAERQRSQELEGITEVTRTRLAAKELYVPAETNEPSVEKESSLDYSIATNKKSTVSATIPDEWA